jgi:hypothetical protein
MDSSVQSWLSDIDQSAVEIFEFLPNRKDFFAFKKD